MSENSKKIIVIMIFFLLIVILIPFSIFKLKERRPASKPASRPSQTVKKNIEESEISEFFGLEESIESSRALGRLPMGEEKIGFDFSDNDQSQYVEYVSFVDFYDKIEDRINPNFSNYKLPINIKTDVVNYYDVSRRLNLDPYLENFNSFGMSLMDNQLDSKNFYDIYDELYTKKIPLLITSDFLIYYYQQKMKEIFKNVEQNVFYKNLWDINYVLFEKAKKRYEERLLVTGNVNDRVLEAERLAAAYFATSLELLKPRPGQVAESGDLSKPHLFGFLEKNIYSFYLPEYLVVDVSREVEFILDKTAKAKSPVLLYSRDYRDFEIPTEYSLNAKLNNFYLATKWLSSTFPLHYRGDDCLACPLDFDDWRISMISASFIANDIFNSHDLKNDWARIYKTLAFFKGLRGDLTYVYYRDALVDCFGGDYDIADVFADDNDQGVDNLYKLQSKILDYDFLKIEGAFDKNNPEEKPKLGVKMLSDFYWPNDFIFNELSYPNVSNYLGDTPPKDNITACKIDESSVRCNGFSLDIVSLISDYGLQENAYYQENVNYNNYKKQMESLRAQISRFPNIWHYNNYWQSLSIVKNYLEEVSSNVPLYGQAPEWSLKKLYTTIGAWANIQVPLDNLKVYQKNQNQAHALVGADFVQYSHVEPNLKLINEQIASTMMVYKMVSLLKISEELRSAAVDLADMLEKLEQIKEIMIKEMKGEPLNSDDLNFISIFAREYKSEMPVNKILVINGKSGKEISYDISSPKLVGVIFRQANKNYLAVGPMFSYTEK